MRCFPISVFCAAVLGPLNQFLIPNQCLAFTLPGLNREGRRFTINKWNPRSLLFSNVQSPDTAQRSDPAAADLSPSKEGTVAGGARRKRVVVVGGGWAGFSAADALATAEGEGVEVVLLDASPRGAGGLAGGWRTPAGRPVEAGVHGFWREYRNTFAAMEAIGLDLDAVLGPYTPSALFSRNGPVAVAPVLKPEEENGAGAAGALGGALAAALGIAAAAAAGGSGPAAGPERALAALAPLLPPPLDVALLAEFSPELGARLTPLDRASGAGLLGAWADFGQEDAASWARYDRVSAEDLFRKYAGVTEALYEELVSPLLHVLPMGPGRDISAAAALSCFHVFALQARGAFDVRWCRGGITEKIFDPWAEKLLAGGRVALRGGARVASIERAGGGGGGGADGGRDLRVVLEGGKEVACDAVVLAVGGVSAGRLAAASPALAGARGLAGHRGVTCVAVRLWLRPGPVVGGLRGGRHPRTRLPRATAERMAASPVAVCGAGVGGLPELAEAGFCVYDLQRMHDEFAVGAAPRGEGGEEELAVLEVDFFRADAVADLADDRAVARLALRAAGAALGAPVIDEADVVDLAVVRARGAVSHFDVGSYARGANAGPRVAPGVYVCGDWVDRGGHASWSTEKAVVTGRQAAAAAAGDLGVSVEASVLPAAPDAAPLAALRRGARALRRAAPPPNADGVPAAPWTLLDTLSRRRRG